MKLIAAIAMLLMVGQAAGEQLVDVQHDSVRGVTCWMLNNTGISCLPDSSLQQTPTSTTNESQAARTSLVKPMCQNEQLSTTPPPPEKGFQL